MTFFLNGPDGPSVDIDYKAARDLEHCKPYRAFIETLWDRYKPSGDGDKFFLSDAKSHFRQRFWEMYLYCALIDHGITVDKTGKVGPDFSFKVAGRKYWVEAIAPTAGEGIDQVQLSVLGVANWVPREQILFRYTHALDTKFKCWQKWQDQNIVSVNDGYIIAINGWGIPDAVCGGAEPYITQSLFPFGPKTFSIDKKTHEVSEPYFPFEAEIKKQSGEPVNTAPFIDKEYSPISAVIHSFSGLTTDASPLGGDFLLLHYLLPQHHLPVASFPWCTRYSFENETLTRKEPTRQLPAW